MCGLLGIGGPRGAELVRVLIRDLAHRGPDDEDVWESPALTLGHRRLAIIGLDKGGRQPMRSRSGDSILVFNGEIYNYLEIADRLEQVGHPADKRYDTAVLLEALEIWDTEILPDLNGMFAFAWYRPREGTLLLVRDRWGEKPLFWGQVHLSDNSAPSLVFSSELRTFARLPYGPPSPDPLGIARYLVYDGMPDDRTIYKGVFKVPPAACVTVDTEGRELSRLSYWRFRPRPAPVPPQVAEERALADLSEAVRLRLRSDVPVGLFLSGGIDSSMLAVLWRRLQPAGRIQTFTVGFEDPSYDERTSARTMASAIGADHHEVVLGGPELEHEVDLIWNHLGEPFADPSIIPTSYLCRFAREHVKVALGGEGGDEIQAGYDPFKAWRASRLMETLLPRSFCRAMFGRLEQVMPASPSNMAGRFKIRHFGQGFDGPPEERIQCWMASFPASAALVVMRPELAAQVDPEALLEPTRRAFREAIDASPLHAQIHVWLRTYLECSILAKVDRASMMHSLEVRAPYLDPGVVRGLTDLPARMIFRNGQGKHVLRRAGAKLLPSSLLSKPKKGFGVPQATWLRTILRERMEEAIRRNRSDGWFRQDAIESMWRAHLSGRADYRRSLWNFLFSFPFQRR